MPDGRTRADPPASLEAEQALLAALLYRFSAIDDIGDRLRPDQFAHPAHAALYEKLLSLRSQGVKQSPVALLANWSNLHPVVSEAGGWTYVVGLYDSVVICRDGDIGHYADVLVDRWRRRGLLDIAETLATDVRAMETDETPEDIQTRAEAAMLALANDGATARDARPLATIVGGAVERLQEAHRAGGPTGLTFGLRDLDRTLGGLAADDLMIIAGRPSMGKTALALALADRAARGAPPDRPSAPVGFFSLEMSGESLTQRLLSAESGVRLSDLRQGRCRSDDFDRMLQAAPTVGAIPIIVDDRAGQTAAGIWSRARRMARRHGIKLIVVDYLQLLAGGGNASGPRWEEMTAITRTLKMIAKDLNIPVLALSQLSRQVEQRETKRPQLSDLRESGSIEQDADVVAFVFREQYYLERDMPVQRAGESPMDYGDRQRAHSDRLNASRDRMEVIIAKARQGPTGACTLHYKTETQAISTLAPDQPQGYGDWPEHP